MRVFLLYILSSIALSPFSQIEGLIYNRTTNLPLSFANIGLVGSTKGCVSNEDGQFSLNVSDDLSTLRIRISAVGIESIELPASSISESDTIWVKEKTTTLAELKVYNNLPPAIEMVRISLNKLPDLGYWKRYALNTFYRHYCAEKDIYGRLIEAAVTLTDNKGHKKKVEKPADKIGVNVTELRKSYDFTTNFDEHEPISIYSTLKYDVMSYPTILSFYPEEYNFRLVDTSFIDSKMLWVIQYNYDQISRVKTDTVREHSSGKIYINSEDYGVYLIEEHKEGTIEKTYETQSMIIDWRVQYQKYEGHYFLKYISETSTSFEEVRSTDQEVVQSKDHKAHVEMMVNEIQLFDVQKNTKTEPQKDELDAMEYHADFWNKYTVLKNTPLDDKIRVDLAKRAELEQQFEGN
ncbi:carboxypeptidase-like regulatory domain-containing protein [Parvicella tangerina]|uniref:Carboxypeptidase-like regulatory domain-containing protein n=1 Tax=Parvicella tangerina TaxID=2829795 RepID=A0A916JP73_9FLAO|nr:carboxypeptidase-like regulatory domain-containing protein [Parvicella tangerina]CAG5085191.1 hypothetical protein CRYO30217_02675 [Parvicella tangerina]